MRSGRRGLRPGGSGGPWSLMTADPTARRFSRETATNQTPVEGDIDGVLMLGTATRRFPSHEEGKGGHLNILLSARSPTLVRKKAPLTKRGQGRVVMCAGGCLGGESQPPARVTKSRLWNWFHGPFGFAHSPVHRPIDRGKSGPQRRARRSKTPSVRLLRLLEMSYDEGHRPGHGARCDRQ